MLMSRSSRVGGAGLGDDTALDDAKAFNKGKGRTLAAMIAMLLVALAALAWYLSQDQGDPYGEVGKQVNGLKSQYFDGFLVCALPGTRLSELKSDADLRVQLHQRGRAGSRYAAHLRDKCSAPLRELGTRLRALLPPSEAAPAIKAMADAAANVNAGVDGFAGHLDALPGAYDEAAAEPETDGIVRGWYEFKKAHAEFNQLVRTKLGR
jgi:hypothetical protein